MRNQILSRILFLMLGCALIVLWLLHGAKIGRTRPAPEPLPTPSRRGPDLDQEAIKRALAIEAERTQIDHTVFAQELLAERHEDVFITLWDNLRAADNAADVLAKFGFGELVLGQSGEPGSAEHDIQVTQLGAPGRQFTTATWQEWIQKLQLDGYQLVQSEWRHAQFHPGRDGARSVIAMTLHVANPARKERWVVRGNLGVHWKSDRRGQPFPERLDATTLELLTRRGEPLFERLLSTNVPTDLNPVFIDPLIVHDLNGDGLSEIILASQNRLYWNRGAGQFQASQICQHPVPALQAAVMADFTGDGFADLLGVDRETLLLFAREPRGTFLSPPQRIPFTPVELPNAFVITAGDVEGDGDLDVWLAQYKLPYVAGQMPTPYYNANDGFPSFLLLNDGQGQFRDATAESGLSQKRFRRTYSASFVDLDSDGDLDLLVVSDFAGVDLYYNNGRGHFTDVTASVLDETAAFGMGHTFGDFNGDGLLDFLVIGMNSYTAQRFDQLGLSPVGSPEHQAMRSKMAYGNRLFFQGSGGWRQGPLSDQVARSGWSWGVSSFDSDNDGDLDFYIANGHKSRRSAKDYDTQFWCHDIYVATSSHDPALDAYFRAVGNRLYGNGQSYGGYEKNRLFLNQNGRAFLEVGFLAGLAMEEDCRNVVSDDLDGDGRLDLLVTTLEVWPQDRQSLHIFRNQIAAVGNWVGVRLREGGSACSPVGAKVTLITPNGHQQVRHLVTGDSFRSQHPSMAHFGLGTISQVDQIEIRCPNGHVQHLQNPALNQFHSVRCEKPVPSPAP